MRKIVMNINSATMEKINNEMYEWAAIELGDKRCILNLYEVKPESKLIVAKKEFDNIDTLKEYMNAHMIECHIQQV
jgi:hypothetical protein